MTNRLLRKTGSYYYDTEVILALVCHCLARYINDHGERASEQELTSSTFALTQLEGLTAIRKVVIVHQRRDFGKLVHQRRQWAGMTIRRSGKR